MAVIINQMEVVVEPPARRDASTGGAEGPPAPPSLLHPHDFEDIRERQSRYELRVAAH